MTINIEDEQAELLASYLHDRFDDERRNLAELDDEDDDPEAVEEMESQKKLMLMMNHVYGQIRQPDLLASNGDVADIIG